jgi:opacity protein-like surface antigen
MRILIVLMLFVLFCTPAAAQDDSEAKYGQRDGRGGLLFLFDELDLNAFAGGVGGKYWLSDLWAMNASLRFRNDGRTMDATGSQNSDFSSTSVGFTTAVERHLARARLSPYVSASIGYLYTHQKNSTANEFNSSETRTNEHEGAVAFGVGVEFWLSHSFSLAGQYDLSVRYTKQKERFNTSTNPDTSELATDEWTTSLGAGSLILAVYF